MNEKQTSKEQIAFLKRIQELYPVEARLDRYLDLAQSKSKQATESEALDIKLLENYVGHSLQALEKNDFDYFAQSFERVVRRAVILDLPEYDKAKHKEQSRSGGKAGEGKHGFFAKMLRAICKQVGTTKNKDVLQCWREYNNRDAYLDVPEDTVWDIYRLWGKRLFSCEGMEDDIQFLLKRNDDEFEYYYFDVFKNCEVQANLAQIRVAMHRIRESGFNPKEIEHQA